MAQHFDSRYFQAADGLKLHYRDYPGPASPALTVVCLPGLTRNGRDFEHTAPRLADRYRVLCLDFRGRGRSQYASNPTTYVPESYVRDLAALFSAAQLHDAVLIGTSLGGLVATLFFASNPDKVRGLVLNDVGPEADPKGLARIGGYVGKGNPVITWGDSAREVERLDRCVYPEYGPDDWMRLARQRYIEESDGSIRLDYDPRVAQMFSSPATTPDLWPHFRRMNALPTLLLRGANSDILSTVTVGRMRAGASALHVVEVPNRGHVPSLEEPLAQAAIESFLRSVELDQTMPAGSAQLVLELCRAISQRDFEGVSSRLAPEAIWTIVGRPDRFAFGGPKKKTELVESLRAALPVFENFRFEVQSWAQNGDTVFVEAMADGQGPGTLRYSNKYLMRFLLSNGQVTQVLEHYDPFEALAFVEQLTRTDR